MESVESEYRKLKVDINTLVSNQYDNFIKRVINKNPTEDRAYIHVYKVIHRFVLPLSIFSWLFQSPNRVNVKFLQYVVKKKVEQDEYVKQITSVLRALNLELITIDKLDMILDQTVISKNEFHKSLIFELLIGELYSSSTDRQQTYRVDGISDRYRTLASELTNTIYEVGFQADHKLFSELIKLMSTNNIEFTFEPERNLDHKYIYTWVKENVIKGLKGERVGCSIEDTPYKYRRPSNIFEDYLKTLNIFHDHMLTIVTQ